jgi:hypothetical protein
VTAGSRALAGIAGLFAAAGAGRGATRIGPTGVEAEAAGRLSTETDTGALGVTTGIDMLGFAAGPIAAVGTGGVAAGTSGVAVGKRGATVGARTAAVGIAITVVGGGAATAGGVADPD